MQSWQRRLSVFQASFQQQTGVTHSIAFPAPHLLQEWPRSCSCGRGGDGCPARLPSCTSAGGGHAWGRHEAILPQSRPRMRAEGCEGSPGCPGQGASPHPRPAPRAGSQRHLTTRWLGTGTSAVLDHPSAPRRMEGRDSDGEAEETGTRGWGLGV